MFVRTLFAGWGDMDFKFAYEEHCLLGQSGGRPNDVILRSKSSR